MREAKGIRDFQDLMGDQLLIMSYTYRGCLERDIYPLDKLRRMAECANKISGALYSYIYEKTTIGGLRDAG